MNEQDQSAGTAAIKECPKCSTKMKITAALRGKRIKCPGCSILLKISEEGEVSVPVMTTFINAKICPSCSTRMRITENLHGKKIKCPKCTTMIQISDTGDVSLAEPEAEERVDERIDDEEPDTQAQFPASDAPKDEAPMDEAPMDEKPEDEDEEDTEHVEQSKQEELFDDDDEQLTVGDDDDEEEHYEPPMQQAMPSYQLRPPEQEIEHEEKPEKKEIPTSSYTFSQETTAKKKGNSGLLYTTIVVALILIVVVVIDLFTGFINGSAQATNNQMQAKPKTDYEITMDLANMSSKYFVEAKKAKAVEENWSDDTKRGAILADYSNAVLNYLNASTKYFGLNQEEKPDDKLFEALELCKNNYLNARFDADLYSVFADSVTMDMCKEMVAAGENADSSMKFAMPILAANDKRNVSLNVLEKWMVELGNYNADDEDAEKIRNFVQMAAEKYFMNTWQTLNSYYEYMKYAKENELSPNPIVIEKVKMIEEIEMGDVEGQLASLGVNVDRNLEAAADVRANVEAQKAEVGDFGKTE